MMSDRDARRILARKMRRKRREFRSLKLTSGRAIAMFWLEYPLGPPHRRKAP